MITSYFIPICRKAGKEKSPEEPDFLYGRQGPVPTLAFGRRCGNNDKNNGTWMHDRGVTIMRDSNPVLPSHYHVLRSHSHPQRSRPHPMATTLPSCGPAAVGRAARNAMRVSTTQTEGARQMPRKESFIPAGRRSSWWPAGCYPAGGGRGRRHRPAFAGRGRPPQGGS